MLESTGRLQKCRIYEMSDNKTLRGTVAFFIARDNAHEMAFAKALETLGVNWGKTLPIPNFDATKYPEVKRLIDLGVHLQQHHFRLDGSEMGKIFPGPAPSAQDDEQLETMEDAPEGFDIGDLPERPEGLARPHTRAHGACGSGGEPQSIGGEPCWCGCRRRQRGPEGAGARPVDADG